jgi:mannosyltransferase
VSTADATVARRRGARAWERLRSASFAVSLPKAAMALAFLVGLSLALRTQAIHARFWIDEGLSVGIASHPILHIPGVLGQDGSPPLYYMLLGVWTRIFGNGEAETHGLSIAFALATIPVAWVFARTLFGHRAAWIAALLATLNPYLTYYAQETRMYSLVVLLSTAATGSFVAAFVQGRRAWLPVFSASLLLLMYTHNWGLFLAVATVVALIGVWRASEDRRALARDALLAYGIVGLLYLPWVPTLLSQARHTGAPWAEVPELHDILNGLTSLLGGPAPAMALLLGAGVGLATLLAPPRRAPRARAAEAILVIFLVALALAWVASQISPAWATRYFAVFLGPVLLLGGAGLARAGRLGLVVLAILVVFWFNPRTGAINAKSNAHTTAVLVSDRLEDGDLVVAAHPEQGPLMHYYLPADVRLRWANIMGPVSDAAVFDWRDALSRLKAAKPTPTADRLIGMLRPGQKLVLVQPIIRTASWRAPWTREVRKRAGQWERVLDRDPRLARTLDVPELKGRPLPRGVRIVLYERR